MDLDQLRTKAKEMLALAREDLRKTKTVKPRVAFFDAMDGSGTTLVLLDQDINFNSPSHKNAFSQRMRQLADEHGYTACVFVSDTWSTGLQTLAQSATVDVVRRKFGCDLVQACRLLDIPMYEQVAVLVQTLGPCLRIVQTYWRDKRGRVTEFEAPVEESIEQDNMRGRMWFLSDRTKGAPIHA
jgi:hypothetical protein